MTQVAFLSSGGLNNEYDSLWICTQQKKRDRVQVNVSYPYSSGSFVISIDWISYLFALSALFRFELFSKRVMDSFIFSTFRFSLIKSIIKGSKMVSFGILNFIKQTFNLWWDYFVKDYRFLLELGKWWRCKITSFDSLSKTQVRPLTMVIIYLRRLSN